MPLRTGRMLAFSTLALLVFSSRIQAETHYVSPAGSHLAPYTNWAEAATNIQSAIAASAADDVVMVTNGIYVLDTTVRVTNRVTLISANGRETALLDGSALPAGQDAVFLQFGTLDGFTVSNAPRAGVKSEYGAIYNSLITHSRQTGIDSYTTPRIVTNSTLVVTNTIVRKSGTNGIYTCAVDTRIRDCVITESGGTGVSLRQNDTTGGPIQVPRVSNFLIRASTISSNLNSGIALAFWNYDASLPDVPVRIEDCRIEYNSTASRGGGIADAAGTATDASSGVQITGSVIRSNRASNFGGGVYFAQSRSPSIRLSTIAGNVADGASGHGGGILTYSGLIDNCLITDNLASKDGGGVHAFYGGRLSNDALLFNRANQGGGVWYGTVRNCIVYYNSANTAPNLGGSSVSYSCLTPLAAGAGNISDSPRLSGFRNWRLVPGSPCIDAGAFDFLEGDYDLEGDPRVWGGGVDMGCDEYYPPGLGGPLSVELESSAARAVVGATLFFKCNVDGRPESYVWQFSDGYSVSNTPFAERAFDAPGLHTVTVTAWNPDDVASNTVSVEIFPGYTNYVSLSGLHVPPFTNRLDAATNIQDAIAANIPGGVVRVADGDYDAGGVALQDGTTNRIAITNVMDVVSDSGPNHARIVGRGPVGSEAVRCAYVATGARLIGFTLTNGHTRAAGDLDRAQSGAGAWCEPGGEVENCIVRNNTAVQFGGGVKNGFVRNSELYANLALDGGGAHGASLSQCILSNNVAIGEGGGMFGGTNRNILVFNNLAEYGGGVARAAAVHATVVSNHAAQSGGGIYRGVASNSIVYFNTADFSWPNYFNTVCRYSCTTPDPQSIGNVVDPPQFVDAARGDYRLLRSSPAVDAAQTTDLAVDLVGVFRPLASSPAGAAAPDMGAYEYAPTVYVAPGGNHVWPFSTWTDAAHDLQSAVDAAVPLNEVLVSNGVYATGGRAYPGTLTNRVVVDKPIRLLAVNGPDHTVIEGAGPIGAAAIRGVYLGTNAALVGFRVQNGATRALGAAEVEQSGGGIWCEADAAISNCLVVSNLANAFGGGVFGGRTVNSFLHANTAAQGGGVAQGTIAFCTVTENRATDGGGAYAATGRASIVYYNEATGAGPNLLGGAWDQCCTSPDPGGAGHVTNAPGLLSMDGYRLALGSPCIDVLPEEPSFPHHDLDGVPRPLDGNANGEALFDLGAHEFIHPTADTDGDGLSDDDEIRIHGTSPLRQDTDGEGQSDLDEVVAGMDPLNPASLFEITQMSAETNGLTFSWPGRFQRQYTVITVDELTGLWTNRADFTEQPGADGPMIFTNGVSNPVEFYGVRVRRTP